MASPMPKRFVGVLRKSLVAPVEPALAPTAMRGYRSAVATPIRAVAAANSRSASRTSGRRRSNAVASPTGSGCCRRGAVAHDSTDLGYSAGGLPVNAAKRHQRADLTGLVTALAVANAVEACQRT